MLLRNNQSIDLFLKNPYLILQKDCENCCGLCCIALYFSKIDGFPKDKKAGEPCLCLNSDNRCNIYINLHDIGLKGCKGYDCFGAGPHVIQKLFHGKSWRNAEVSSKEMFDVFLMMVALHEFLWYLATSLCYDYDFVLKKKTRKILEKIYILANQSHENLLNTDLLKLRNQVRDLLNAISKNIRFSLKDYEETFQLRNPLECLEKDLRNEKLRGQSLKGACLIQADLSGCDLSYVDMLGVDFRDTNIRNANLKHTLFLNQRQVNVAIGNKDTILPKGLKKPDNWK